MRYAVVLSVLAVAACGAGSDQTEMDDEASLPAAEVNEAEQAAMATLESLGQRYADVAAAVADGYMMDPSGACVTAEMVGLPADQGAMGVHYIQPQYVGLVADAMPVHGTDGVLDWERPEVLVYEPQADGSQQLVAIEYLTSQQAWTDAGNTAPPQFHGTPFVAMADDPNTPEDEAHGFTAHYELHIWTPRENPNGMYAEFNPAVTCEHAAAHAMD
jgi:hypothetical protein